MKGIGKGGKYSPQGGNTPPNRARQSQAVFPRSGNNPIKKTPTFSTAAFAKATNISADNDDDLDRKINNAIEAKVNPLSLFRGEKDFIAKNNLLDKLARDRNYAAHIESDDHPGFTKVTIAVTIQYYGAEERRVATALDNLIDSLSGRSGVVKRTPKNAKIGHSIDDENLVNSVVTTTTGSCNNTTNGTLNNATGGDVIYGVMGGAGSMGGGFNYNYGAGSGFNYYGGVGFNNGIVLGVLPPVTTIPKHRLNISCPIFVEGTVLLGHHHIIVAVD